MEGLLSFLIGYVLLLLAWLLINAVSYALTVMTKKGFFFIPYTINILINWAIQIYFIIWPLYLVWQILVAKEWLLLILALIFGSFYIGFQQMIVAWLTMPFSYLTLFFVTEAEKKTHKDEEVDYEYISSDGKVVGKYTSIDKKDRIVTKWFLISLVIAYLNQAQADGNPSGPIWYVVIPFIVLITWIVILGILLGLWNLVRRRHFFGADVREYFTKILKIYSFIYGLSVVSTFFIILFTNV